MIQALKALSARLITLIVAFVSGLMTTRMIISHGGAEAYSLYTLIAALPSLVPFLDFGAGAAIVNSVARSENLETDALVRAQLRTTVRITAASGAVLVAISLVLAFSDLWPSLLGSASAGQAHVNEVVVVCAMAFAVSLPLGLWARVMLGMRKNHWVVLVQGLQPLLTLGVVFFILSVDQNANVWLGVAAYISILAISFIGATVASVQTKSLFVKAILEAPFIGKHPGAQVMHVGWPMLAQTLAPPISVQFTRLIVAQFVSVYALAQYGMLLQVVTPISGLVSTVGATLWPYYVRAQQRSEKHVGPFRMAALFAIAAASVGAFLVLVGPALFSFISNGHISVSRPMIACFSMAIIAQAMLYPLGMYMMDAVGLRFQVIPAMLMALGSVAFVLVFAPTWGIVSAPVGVTFFTAIAQIIPFSLRIAKNRS